MTAANLQAWRRHPMTTTDDWCAVCSCAPCQCRRAKLPEPSRGWECPKCNRIYGPHVNECRECNAWKLRFYP